MHFEHNHTSSFNIRVKTTIARAQSYCYCKLPCFFFWPLFLMMRFELTLLCDSRFYFHKCDTCVWDHSAAFHGWTKGNVPEITLILQVHQRLFFPNSEHSMIWGLDWQIKVGDQKWGLQSTPLWIWNDCPPLDLWDYVLWISNILHNSHLFTTLIKAVFSMNLQAFSRKFTRVALEENGQLSSIWPCPQTWWSLNDCPTCLSFGSGHILGPCLIKQK